jgi:hypothetical protein
MIANLSMEGPSTSGLRPLAVAPHVKRYASQQLPLMLLPTETATLTAEQEVHVRLYRRLWLTEIDLEEAQGAINEIIKRNLRRPGSYKPTPLLQSLTTALVVAYTRPFVMSRGNPAVADRTVPGSLLRVYTADERAFHEILVTMRNREVAHSDADLLQISLEVFPEGHGAVCKVARDPLSRPQLRALLRMIDKLQGELELRFEALRAKLPHHVWL